jgi:glycosyltransferase involved in cell wall biosynthesis
MTAPFFSIVITVYNRPVEILRCVQSCLSQSYAELELIVVNDCSTDSTPQVLEQFDDSRLKIIHHSSNRGAGAARNTGDKAAQGEWVIRLDSDHALLPGALETLHDICMELPVDIAVMGACYQWESGMITPRILPAGDLDYIERICWAEAEGGHDNLSCTRRMVFDQVYWHECMDPNSLFQLDQAKLFRTRIIPDVLAMEYTPQISIIRSPTGPRWDVRRQQALQQARYFALMLEKHGPALRAYGPFQYRRTCLRAAFFFFLSCDRKNGIQYLLRFLRLAPSSLSGWSLFFTGLAGPGAMKLGYIVRDYLGATVKDHEI